MSHSRGQGGADAPDANGAAGSEIRKQAVVVIHGMGEQQPMGTLRSLARALWLGDDAIENQDGTPKKESDLWLAPDTRTGSTELMRMTTGVAKDGYRVDFFEFYWADIMAGNTRQQLFAWITTLLVRWPHSVPGHVFFIWLLLWLFTLVFVIASAVGTIKATLYNETPPPESTSGAICQAYSHIEASFTSGLSAIGTFIAGFFDGAPWFLLFAALMIFAVVYSAIRFVRQQTIAGQPFNGPVLFSLLIAALRPVIAVLFLIVVGYLLYQAWSQIGFNAPFATALTSLVLGFALNMFILPYLGDVARYVQSKPDTVSRRAQVRERGLRLLRALHGLKEDGSGPVDPDAPQPYGRVTIVCHSLGSIIGYDLLNQFWAEAGFVGKDGLKSADALAQLKTIDDEITRTDANPEKLNLAKYRGLQWELALRLTEEGNRWRITDFVTMGSPARHAEFLIARNKGQFRQYVSERMLSLCPPRDISHRNGKREHIFYPLTDRENKVVGEAIHHGALFSAVRWSNIYDNAHPVFFLFGDVVSGPARAIFGQGINDFRIRMRRKGVMPGLRRLVTHTLYWAEDASADIIPQENTDADGFTPSGTHDDHIRLLRHVVNLNAFAALVPALDKADAARGRKSS